MSIEVLPSLARDTEATIACADRGMAMATTASVYNYERTTRQILKRHRKDAASFVIHLHAQFMRFEKQVRASA